MRLLCRILNYTFNDKIQLNILSYNTKIFFEYKYRKIHNQKKKIIIYAKHRCCRIFSPYITYNYFTINDARNTTVFKKLS